MSDRARTEADIASIALDHIGEDPISSLDDGSARAVTCRIHFGSVRDDVLREHWWNFAKAWVRPSQDPVPSEGPLKNRFPLPADCVAVRFVKDLGADEWELESSYRPGSSEIEAQVLVCNSAEPLVCYTRRVTNVSLWDAEFCTAFALKLAAKIAAPLARSFSLASQLDARGDVKVGGAQRRNAREKAGSTISRDVSWIRARFVRGWGR
ncbi:hypothetical protein IP86_02980 [Rhodopseudomonas sp. AAP120]|uniref:hypothetical protein n=1 Tax=Rhodopseudomonas sp. AAP120 TaxID=1523430 RepID=UPI0006B8942F|nr:hypothetical protein [Rhodopseudomonas sp. AAP120]KPG01788.1 hypothetical protein IP86_02980 [Rhodopseudomonas sp. AAP120]